MLKPLLHSFSIHSFYAVQLILIRVNQRSFARDPGVSPSISQSVGSSNKSDLRVHENTVDMGVKRILPTLLGW